MLKERLHTLRSIGDLANSYNNLGLLKDTIELLKQVVKWHAKSKIRRLNASQESVPDGPSDKQALEYERVDSSDFSRLSGISSAIKLRSTTVFLNHLISYPRKQSFRKPSSGFETRVCNWSDKRK
jgi:hypothetical protein